MNPDPMATASVRLARPSLWGTRLLLGLWGVSLNLIIVFLVGSHWVAFREPDAAARQAIQTFETRNRMAQTEGTWQALHVLYRDCGCSQRVARHLLHQGPHPRCQERIVMVGEPDPRWAAQATERGFPIEFLTSQELAVRYQIEAAPLLVILDPMGEVVYAGGYTRRKQGADFQTHQLIESLQQGQSVEVLPVYGCAVSEKMQALVDPLRIKRALVQLDQAILVP